MMSASQQQQQQQNGSGSQATPARATTATTTAASECKTASAPVKSPNSASKAILPLIGTTQSGKTTFIKFLHDYCDQDYDHARDLVVGDGVNSCTKVCKRYSLAVPDRTVTLVPKAGSRPASSLVSAAGGVGSGMALQQQQTQVHQSQASSTSASFAGGSPASNAATLSGESQETRSVSTLATSQQQQQQRFSAARSSVATSSATHGQLGAHVTSSVGVAGQDMVPQQPQRTSLATSSTSAAISSTSASANHVSAAQAAALAAREAAAKSVAMAAEAAKMCQTIGSVISESEISDSDDEGVDSADAAKFHAEQVAFLRQQQHQQSTLSAPSLAQRDSMSSIASNTTAATSTAFTCESSSGSSGSDSNGMVAVGASMVASVSGTGGAAAAGPSSTIMTPEITSLNTSASHSPVMLHGQALGGLLSQQAQQQQQQLLSQQQYQHMTASHSSSDGCVPEFARPSPPLPATETPSSIVVEPMISATMQSQQSSSLSSSMITSHQQQNQQALSSTGAESQQHDPDTLRIVENAIRIATGLPATGGAQLTTPPPHIAQYIDSMTARHQCQEHFQEECAKHQQQVQKEGNEVQAQGSAGGFSFSFKASTSSSSSNSAGTAVETRDRGLFGAESSGASIETTEEQTKDRGLFGFRKWVGKKVHGGTTTTTISSDAAQFEHEAGTTIEPTDSMLSTTSTTTSMMTVTDTNVGSANATAACGQATDQVQVTCQQPPECLGPMSSGEVITMSRRSSISSSSSDDSDQGLGRRHRIKTKIGGMLGLSSSATSSSVQYQQQQEGSEHHEQTCVTSSADLYSQQCQDQLHDSSAEWSSTVHYAVTPSGQVVLDASGPSATMHQGSFAYPTGPSSTTMVGVAAVGGMVGAGIGAAAASGATAGASSQESQWTVVNHAATSNSPGLSATQVQQATSSTQQAQQSTQAHYQLHQHQQQQQQQQQFQQTCVAQSTNASMPATRITSTTQVGQSLTEMLARLEQSYRESMAQHNGGTPLSASTFLLDPQARLEYLEEIEDLLHNRHLQLYVGPPKSKTPRLKMDLIDTPGLLDAAAFTDPFVDLDHLAGILAQVKRAGHVTALVYVINVDRPYDSASLEALVTYLTNLRELCSNLIVIHSSYNVHKVLESAKAAAVSSASTGEPSSFCLFDLGNRISEFNKQLAQLGFPDIRPVHVAMDNVVPETARAGIKALCYEGLHVFLDVVEEFAKQKVTPIERVSMVKLRLIRDVDMHVSVFLTNIIDTIRAQLYTLGQSGNETQLLIAAEKLATTRAELRRIESELARLDTDDHVEIDQRTVKRLPMTIVREGTRRALVVLVYESKAGNIRSARLVQPRWPRAYVRHEHVDPKRYVAVLAPPPSSPWAVGPYVHVQLFTHRRDVFTVEIGKLRIVKGELAGKLTEQEAELAKWTRKLGEEKKKVAELETRLTTLKRALGVVDGDRLPLELFVEVVDQYREIAKLQYAGKRVDQVLVKALGESVERFFYRRC